MKHIMSTHPASIDRPARLVVLVAEHKHLDWSGLAVLPYTTIAADISRESRVSCCVWNDRNGINVLLLMSMACISKTSNHSLWTVVYPRFMEPSLAKSVHLPLSPDEEEIKYKAATATAAQRSLADFCLALLCHMWIVGTAPCRMMMYREVDMRNRFRPCQERWHFSFNRDLGLTFDQSVVVAVLRLLGFEWPIFWNVNESRRGAF